MSGSTRQLGVPLSRRKLAREEARQRREGMRKLRDEIRSVIRQRKGAMHEAALECQAERKRLREEAKELRRQALGHARQTAKEQKQAARDACRARKAEVRESSKPSTAQAHAELREERSFQREMRRAEGRARKRQASRTTAAERRQESDDEVRANLPPELVSVFDQVRRSIKASPYESRTEAFQRWAEENPEVVIQAQEELAERELRKLLREQRAVGHQMQRAKRRPKPTADELAAIPF